MGTDPVRHNLPPFAEMRADAFDMYNHLPYVKDIYLCTKEMIRPVTGNVIKYFTIRNEEPAVIDTNVLAQQLVEQEARRLRRSRTGIAQADMSAPEADPAAAEQPAVRADEEIAAPSAGAAAEKPSAAKAPAGNQTKTSEKNAFAGFGEEDEDDFSFLRKK